eukprot:1090806-Pleurochrysis_carterae.AAC.1
MHAFFHAARALASSPSRTHLQARARAHVDAVTYCGTRPSITASARRGENQRARGAVICRTQFK